LMNSGYYKPSKAEALAGWLWENAFIV
jgi:hypothetical protein